MGSHLLTLTAVDKRKCDYVLHLVLGPTQPHRHWVPVSLFPVVKWLWLEADQSPPADAPAATSILGRGRAWTIPPLS